MRKILNLSIAFLLAITLSVATVLCCCIAPSVVAHFHKTVTCSHCAGQTAHGKSSNPAAACPQQLTSADFYHLQTIISPVVKISHFQSFNFLIAHQSVLNRSLLFAYPPGGLPLGRRFTPLYLRTFQLRI